MTILVTGGAGFIGSHIADALMQAQYQVVVLDDLSGGFANNVVDGITFVQGSILDKALIENLFETHKFEYVFHLAAYAAENLSHFIRHYNYEVNVLGSINLINASVNHGVKCFVFTSSAGVYGKNELPFCESAVPRPYDPYGIAKWSVEQDLMAAQSLFGLPYVVFRPHNVFGERQNIGDKYRNVVGIFMNQVLLGKPLTIFGDGTQTRPFTYIHDIVPTIISAIERPEAHNQVFNIGSDREVTLNELAQHIADVVGVEPQITYLDARHEVKHVNSSHDKLRQFLPVPDETPLRDALANMFAWVQTHGSRTSADFDPIEIMQKLPPSWRPKQTNA